VELQPVLDLIAAASPARPCTLVGIGGHGGAGKTTLASLLPGAQIVPTDAFWSGEGFDLERLAHDVVEPLLRGEVARYAAWSWADQAPDGERVVVPVGLVVVEGVCALHRLLRDAYDVRVWVDAPYEVRLARGVERDGEGARSAWVERWIPAEERYVERDDPVTCAHLVVDGSRPL
jgi:uridine kinase